MNVTEDVMYRLVLRSNHLDDHGAQLKDVGDEKVDDVDRSNITFLYLQENIGKSKQTVVNMF